MHESIFLIDILFSMKICLIHNLYTVETFSNFIKETSQINPKIQISTFQGRLAGSIHFYKGSEE